MSPAAQTPTRTRQRRARWPLLIALLLPFVAVEVWIRQVKMPSDLDFYTGRENRASESDYAFTDAFSAYAPMPSTELIAGKTVNAHGFMGTPELEREKPEGVVRIAFLGGSSTAGMGIDLRDTQTWPWKVAETLGALDLGDASVDFLNASLGGYTTFESLGRLWSRVRFFDPDVVVLYHGWNELYYFTPRRVESIHRWRMLRDGDWTLQRTDNPHARFEPWAIDPFIGWSQLLVKLRLRLGRQRTGEQSAEAPVKALATDYDPRAPEIFRDNLRLIRSTCESLGMELFVVKQATLLAADNSDADRARCQVAYHGFDAEAHLRAYAALHQVVDEEIASERIIDGSVLDGRSDLFHDHVHPTSAGTTALAELVSGPLAQWIGERER